MNNGETPTEGIVFGPGNIEEDPLFSVNFYLKSASPCRDAGDPDSQYDDLDGTRNDMGIYGGPLGEIPSDLDGDCYVGFQDFLILQVNFGKSSGALHSEGDLDNDGDVDFQDFLILQIQFGISCP